MSTHIHPRWQPSQDLAAWVLGRQRNIAITGHLGCFGKCRSVVQEVGNRNLRLIDRIMIGSKPPQQLTGFMVIEPSPSGDGFHLHGALTVVGERQIHRWFTLGVWKWIANTLACLSKKPGGDRLPSLDAYRVSWHNDQMFIKTGDLSMPDFHTSLLDAEAWAKWHHYMEKDRACDPLGDRILVGHSFQR